MKSLLVLLVCMFIICECNTVKDFFSINKSRCSPNCLTCDSGICIKCNRGLYSLKNACFESCPSKTYADNYTFRCMEKHKNPFYMKSYTLSRCINSCGKVFHECSCHPSCEKTGDCCSDYQVCEIIAKNHSTDCLVSNCKFCSSDRKICLQCKENFFYHKSICITSCPENTSPNGQNICNDNNSSLKCPQGTYSNEGKCLKSCPQGLRANRIDFTCKNEREFAFYWVFPSRETCENKCGDNTKSDCSCKFTCLRRGNCCDNFEKECSDEMKKEKCNKLCENCVDGKCEKCKVNSKFTHKKECECENKYNYDLEEDICILDKLHELEYMKNQNLTNMIGKLDYIMVAKQKLKNEKIVFLAKNQINKEKIEKTIENENISSRAQVNIGLDIDTENHPIYFTNNKTDSQRSNPENYDKLSNSLTSHLKSTFFKLMDLIKSNPSNDNQMAMYLNGNISLNLMNDNEGTKLIDNNNFKINSNNDNSQIRHNINSFNKLDKIKKQGNVDKSINQGQINSGNTFKTKPSKNESLFRKLDLKSKPYINHERKFDNSPILDIEDPVMTEFKKPSFLKPTDNIIPKTSPILQNTDVKNSTNTINDTNFLNTKLVKEQLNQESYTTKNIINENPNIDKETNNQSQVNILNNPHPKNNQDIAKSTLIGSSSSNKALSLTTKTKSLIIGEDNLIKDNHLIHNIINVRNNYIIPARNISNFFKSIGKDQATIQGGSHGTYIVVNANKISSNDTLKQ